MFQHWTFPSPADKTEALLEAAKALPEFSGMLEWVWVFPCYACIPACTDTESLVDYIPYVVQPEPLPTNGRHALLEFRYKCIAKCIILLVSYYSWFIVTGLSLCTRPSNQWPSLSWDLSLCQWWVVMYFTHKLWCGLLIEYSAQFWLVGPYLDVVHTYYHLPCQVSWVTGHVMSCDIP